MDEGSVGKPPASKLETNRLSPEHAFQLLFLSFRFSQGTPDLQEEIFKWIHFRYPSYKLTQATYTIILRKIKEVSKKLILETKDVHTSYDQRGDIGKSTINKDSLLACKALQETLNGDDSGASSTDYQSLIFMLSEDLINRDHKFLIQGGGRYNPANPMLSHVMHFALSHKSTGCPEYDQMFREVGDLINEERAKQAIPGAETSKLPLIKLEEIEKVHQNK